MYCPYGSTVKKPCYQGIWVGTRTCQSWCLRQKASLGQTDSILFSELFFWIASNLKAAPSLIPSGRLNPTSFSVPEFVFIWAPLLFVRGGLASLVPGGPCQPRTERRPRTSAGAHHTQLRSVRSSLPLFSPTLEGVCEHSCSEFNLLSEVKIHFVKHALLWKKKKRQKYEKLSQPQ